jgi:hypothetical protein
VAKKTTSKSKLEFPAGNSKSKSNKKFQSKYQNEFFFNFWREIFFLNLFSGKFKK